MNRNIFIITGAAIAAVLCGALILRDGEDPRTGDASAPRTVSEVPAGDSESTQLDAFERVPVLADAPEVVQAPVQDEAASPSPEEPSWRDCISGRASEAEMRACLQDWLQGAVLDPTELAELTCGDGAVDAGEMLLIAEAAALWPAVDALSRITTYQEICGEIDQLAPWWSSFLGAQCTRDPSWCEVFATTFDGPQLFREDGRTFALDLAVRLARQGDDSLRRLLEEGARGRWGGTPEQVSLAMSQAWEYQGSSEDRLSFLRGVSLAPEFQGRDFEVDELMGKALHPRSIPDRDVEASLTFVHELLSDPRYGSGAAEHLLVLNDWDQLPKRFDAEQRAELVRVAEALVGPRD